jgi:hypothetical protein
VEAAVYEAYDPSFGNWGFTPTWSEEGAYQDRVGLMRLGILPRRVVDGLNRVGINTRELVREIRQAILWVQHRTFQRKENMRAYRMYDKVD